MARSLADAQISFGLVNIPVKLYAASEAHSTISFNMLHAACGTRVKQQLWCPTCEVQVERADTVKGYEFERGKYVRFTADELKAIEEDSSKQIEIDQFLPAGTIDPVYFDRPYYLGTDKAGEKAYNLMAEALLQSMRVGIGKYHARGRDYLVVVRPRGPGSRDGLVMQELLYADEVRDFSEVPITVAAVSEREIGLALQIIEQGAKETFDPTLYRDERRAQIQALVDQKVAGESITKPSAKKPSGDVIDLVEALRASLRKSPVAAVKPTKSATQKRKAKG